MSESVGYILTVALMVMACAIQPTASGKGFNANGEKDNGKCK